MKKRFVSILLVLSIVLTLLPVTASAEESFDSFATRMRSEYDVIITCERDTQLTAEEQGYIEDSLSAWGKEFVRTISGGFSKSKYFGTMSRLSNDRMKIVVSNPDFSTMESALYGKASGSTLYLYGNIWDNVTVHHEFAHMVKHACESASTVNCYGKLVEVINEVNREAISISGNYGSPWQSGVDELFYAFAYGKSNADEDIATIMGRIEEPSWIADVKNGKMPLIIKKLQAFRDYYEKYLTGGIAPCLLVDNILGPSTNRPTEAMGSYFNIGYLQMNAGETAKREVIGSFPSSATELFEITSVRSQNPKIAKVDPVTGVITALSEGTTHISYLMKTATHESNIGFQVDVKGSVLPSDIQFDFPTTLKVGDKVKTNITFLPVGSISPAEPRWGWTANQVISVKDGELTALRPGKATLSCRISYIDLDVKVDITVEPAMVTGITLNETEVSKLVGGTIQLKPTLSPAGSTGTVTYSSSDESVATVSDKGLVTTKKVGTAVITARVGTFTATCIVNVTPPALTGISLSPAQAGIKVGETIKLNYTLMPAKAVGTVTYTTSNPAVATVSDTGLVTGIKAGTATITAKVGNFSATTKITVTNIEPKGVTLDKTNATVEAGSTIQITATPTQMELWVK